MTGQRGTDATYGYQHTYTASCGHLSHYTTNHGERDERQDNDYRSRPCLDCQRREHGGYAVGE